MISMIAPNTSMENMREKQASVTNYEEVINSTEGEYENCRGGSGHDPVAAYLAEGETNDIRAHEWTYNSSLGLSIEKIKEGFTFESLWEVVENNKN